MTMDMHIRQRGGLRVEAAAAVLSKTTASPASSESSERTGSPASSPAASPAHHISNNNNKSPPPQQTSKMSIKRSFDVAFLMAPDDLSTIKKRHQEQQLRLVTTASLMKRSAMTPLNVSITQPSEHGQQRILQQHPPSLMVGTLHDEQAQQARSAFTKVSSSAAPLPAHLSAHLPGHLPGSMPGSGLLLMQNPPLPTSPSSVSSLSAGGLSPDHSAYQNSLSPSPGPGHASSAASTPTSTPVGLAPGAGPLPGAGTPPYAYQPSLPYGAPPFYVPQQPSVAPPPPSSPSPAEKGGKGRRYSPPSPAANGFHFASYPKPQELMAGFHKLRPSGPLGPGLGSSMLYPDSLAAYTNLAAAAAAAYPFGPAPGPGMGPGMGAGMGSNMGPSMGSNMGPGMGPGMASGMGPHSASPNMAPSPALAAAAVVSASLMPPTFAALSLPAQNVCAKCNVSFRMTSDLVYHMRAHHKSDHAVNDPSRRRREQDKLKCPVCAESFRERHHLTRHMTAHQDKDGDAADDVDHSDAAAPGQDKAAAASVARRRTNLMAGSVAK